MAAGTEVNEVKIGMKLTAGGFLPWAACRYAEWGEAVMAGRAKCCAGS